MSPAKMKREFLRFSECVFDILGDPDTLRSASLKDLVSAWSALYDKLYRDDSASGSLSALLKAAEPNRGP